MRDEGRRSADTGNLRCSHRADQEQDKSRITNEKKDKSVSSKSKKPHVQPLLCRG